MVATTVHASIAAHRDPRAAPPAEVAHVDETAHVEEPVREEVPAVVVEAPADALPLPPPTEAPRRVTPTAVARTPSSVPEATTAAPAVATPDATGNGSMETAPEAAAPSPRVELESLRAIGDAVEGHRAEQALAAIEAHRARYPSSLFAQELLLLEAEARWARRETPVCSLLSTFRTRYPRGLLRRRAETLAAEARCPGSTEP
jgi:hypothetical protein